MNSYMTFHRLLGQDFFRYYQKDCFDKLYEAYNLGEKKCLSLMFCGTGKTRVFYTFMLDFQFSIAVFPTLALADQFISDYVENPNLNCGQFGFAHLRVSSQEDGERKAKTTTSPEQISLFLEKSGKKIIAVTYASLDLLFNCMKELGVVADTIIYDESHHVVGEKGQKTVFDVDTPVRFHVFFTATYVNRNGVVMFNPDGDDSSSDCGPCIFRYTLQQAIEDGFCQDFEFCIFISQCDDVENETAEGKLKRTLKLLANAIVTNDCSRIIVNHAFSEAEDDVKTSVRTFATEENEKILLSEIRNLGCAKPVIYNGVSANRKNRADIVKAFNQKSDDIQIISQCKIFAEGVDTRHADMTVFIDEKGSCHVIIQTIGRVTRKKHGSDKKGIVLLPICIDKGVMESAKTEEERDAVIRDCINEERNFNPILNVMTALREEDPEYYDMCLKYPNTFSPKEIEEKIVESGKKLGEKGTLKKAVETLVRGEVEELSEREEDLEKVASMVGKPIRVVTQSMEDGKTFENYGEQFGGDVFEIFRDEDGLYQPILEKEGCMKREISKPRRKPFANRIKVQSDCDFKIFYGIDAVRETMTNELMANLKSEIFYGEQGKEKWKKILEEIKQFIDEDEKRPNKRSKDPKEKRLGHWLSTQLNNTKSRSKIMKDDEIYKEFTTFLSDEKYAEYFLDNKTQWRTTMTELVNFIDKNGKRPSDKSKEPKEKRLAKWLCTYFQSAKSRSQIMKDDEIYNEFTTFLSDEKYAEYFLDSKTQWRTIMTELVNFIDKNAKRPLDRSKDPKEKRLGQWLSTQLWNAKSRSYIMKDDEIHNEFTTFLSDEKYAEYFLDNKTQWSSTMSEVSKFIDKNGKRPCSTGKDPKEKRLGQWLSSQICNAKSRSKIMKDDEIYDEFTTFLSDEKYAEYFLDNKTQWRTIMTELVNFIDENEKRPSEESKDPKEKRLGQWLSSQICNAKSRSKIMKDDEIYDEFTTFLSDEKYAEYFLDNKTQWRTIMTELVNFIDKNGKRPSAIGKEPKEKRLGQWLSNQLKKAKSRSQIMKDDEIYNEFTTFISDPKYKKNFPTLQPETTTLIQFECSSCNLIVENVNKNGDCATCQKKLQTPSTHLSTPMKTLEECRERVQEMSPEEKDDKLAKKLFQEQKGYRPDKKKIESNKIRANSLFSERSRSFIGNALILDSSNFLTTKALMEVGYNREQIFIPQYDKDEYNVQKQAHRHVYNQSLYDYLLESEDAKFSTAWFDYTCTFGGNVACRPEKDIELYFSRRFPEDESTFAVTFCKREKAEDDEDLVKSVKDKISKIAKKSGYALTDEVLFEYDNMYFLLWEVVERKRKCIEE